MLFSLQFLLTTEYNILPSLATIVQSKGKELVGHHRWSQSSEYLWKPNQVMNFLAFAPKKQCRVVNAKSMSNKLQTRKEQRKNNRNLIPNLSGLCLRLGRRAAGGIELSSRVNICKPDRFDEATLWTMCGIHAIISPLLSMTFHRIVWMMPVFGIWSGKEFSKSKRQIYNRTECLIELTKSRSVRIAEG